LHSFPTRRSSDLVYVLPVQSGCSLYHAPIRFQSFEAIPVVAGSVDRLHFNSHKLFEFTLGVKLGQHPVDEVTSFARLLGKPKLATPSFAEHCHAGLLVILRERNRVTPRLEG